MEFSPGQPHKMPRPSQYSEGLGSASPEGHKMRPEVQEIASQLDISEETFENELHALEGADKDEASHARKYLEEMQMNLIKWANLLDKEVGWVKPEETEVRGRIAMRLGKLFDTLEGITN